MQQPLTVMFTELDRVPYAFIGSGARMLLVVNLTLLGGEEVWVRETLVNEILRRGFAPPPALLASVIDLDGFRHTQQFEASARH